MISGVYASGDITLKGIYGLGSVLNASVSRNDPSPRLKVNTEYNLNSGFGLGVEYPVLKFRDNSGEPGNFEVLGGLSYMLNRQVSSYKDRPKSGTTSLPNQKTELAQNDLRIQTTSLYLRPRYMFTLKNMPSIKPYVGGKLSYNFIKPNGNMQRELKLDNSIGYGLSLGSIISKDWDMELAWERIGAKAKDDRMSDTMNGTYNMSNIYLSVGYRI
jgi:hypothetical protein